jgi:hypothetical protein
LEVIDAKGTKHTYHILVFPGTFDTPGRQYVVNVKSFQFAKTPGACPDCWQHPKSIVRNRYFKH